MVFVAISSVLSILCSTVHMMEKIENIDHMIVLGSVVVVDICSM